MSRSSFSARTLLNLGVGLSAIAATPAMAQVEPTDPAADPQAEAAFDDTIVVTARRREENLLDVPISVTAYSGEALENQGAIDITAISDTTPNVTLENSRATNSTLSAFIRGVGQQDPVGGFEAGVGIYLDDVYLNRPQAAVLDIYDVERIRGAARAAGHALRPQHHRRRGQICHAPPARRFRGQAARDLWQL